jgi:hypothetical protein
MSKQSQVWVAYAAQNQQFHISLPFQEGMTALEAVELSGIRRQIDLPETLLLGIFGIRLQNLQQKLQAGDRVEIYRALTINPKEIRRKRAAENPVGRYCRGNRFKQLKS